MIDIPDQVIVVARRTLTNYVIAKKKREPDGCYVFFACLRLIIGLFHLGFKKSPSAPEKQQCYMKQ